MRSSSLIPPPESGLLLTNAGMNQFIPYFLGQAEAPFRRADTCQKCFGPTTSRTSGTTPATSRSSRCSATSRSATTSRPSRRVGARARHRGLRHRSRPAVDDGLRGRRRGRSGVWSTGLGIPPERIVRALDAGEPTNYWRTHAAGPAGPCSEIFVDRGPATAPRAARTSTKTGSWRSGTTSSCRTEVDGDAAVLARSRRRTWTRGPRLERVAMVLQGVDNVFETDLLRPILEVGERRSGRTHGADPRDDTSLKIIAEHGRAATFLIADGVQPANEGRGYILRRMLRRVVSHARRLGIEGGMPRRRDHDRHRAVRRDVPRTPGERGLHPPGRRLGGGPVLGDVAAGPRPVRGVRRTAPSIAGSRARTRSSCTTRTGSRSSCSRRSRAARG